MTTLSEDAEVAIANLRSQTALTRTLEFSAGHFVMVLARCNYGRLRIQTLEWLQQNCSLDIQTLELPPDQSLYAAIATQISAQASPENMPQALMVTGLEAVQSLDQILISTNYAREAFRQNFPFPIVLWVTDAVINRLVELSQTLKVGQPPASLS
ncbi:MAG: hypothetical protein HC780_02765 [Leptolyngbyaceae cyanobacterium CSU_1_3]|nr:hypothetical protein [Leptolyngbyaceae cyanobacterium CSU_1_3]